MTRAATKVEAERFVHQFGAAAYQKALEAEKLARRRRNARLAKFLKKVVLEIASRGTGQVN